jgi:hypothetical protein
MGEARSEHAAVLLADGRVLVVGGVGAAQALFSGEIFDPEAETWTPVPKMQSGGRPSAIALPDGTSAVVTTSIGTNHPGSTVWQRYQPTTNSWSGLETIRTGTVGQCIALLDGGLLMTGGTSEGRIVRSMRYRFDLGTWSAGAAPAENRGFGAMARLADGRVLLAGGVTSDGIVGVVELFDVATDAWIAEPSLEPARHSATATTLGDGTILVGGGFIAPYGVTAVTERLAPGG